MSQPLRTCRVCGRKALTKSDLELFKKDKGQPFGRGNICKVCKRLEVNAWRKINKTRRREDAKKYWRNHRKEYILTAKLWKRRNPEKVRAHEIVRKCVSLGPVCVKCGSTENLVRHHPDYSKPLEVVILCRFCHGAIHSKYLEASQ